VALNPGCEHSSNSSSSSSSTTSRFDSSSTLTQHQQSHKSMVRSHCTFSVSEAAHTPWLEASGSVQQTAEQVLSGVQLQPSNRLCIQQPGHLPSASLTISLLHQLSDHVSSFQQQFVQSGHCPQADHSQCYPAPDSTAAQHHHQQQQQQMQLVQQDRLAPLFTLSEYTQQGASSRSKHDLPPDRNKLRTRSSGENPASQPGTLCVETDAGGRQRVYRTRSGVDKGSGKMWEGFDMVRAASMLLSEGCWGTVYTHRAFRVLPCSTVYLQFTARVAQQQLMAPHSASSCQAAICLIRNFRSRCWSLQGMTQLSLGLDHCSTLYTPFT
jgi:hypothetical protein